MGWLFSILGIGGLGAALIFIPGLAARLLEILKGLIGIVAEYPWQALNIGLMISCGLLLWWMNAIADERDLARAQLKTALEWQAKVTEATRLAAHHRKLGIDYVADQITIMGRSIDQFDEAQKEALRKALAAKDQEDRRNRERKRQHDDALPSQIDERRRRTDAYVASNSLPRNSGQPTADNQRGDAGTSLPEPAFGTQKPDGPDHRSELVVVTEGYMRACDVVTARLLNAQDWAQGLPK